MIEKKDENGITELEKALNLISKISTNNMNYYNRDSVITNVNDPNKILKEFCEVKLQCYKDRREYQINSLNRDIENISVKMRFILEFISGEIQISKKKKSEIIEQLKTRGYPVSPSENDYMYLLRMPIYNLTYEKIQELLEKKGNLEQDLAFLESTHPCEMWVNELDKLSPVKVKIMKKKAVFKK